MLEKREDMFLEFCKERQALEVSFLSQSVSGRKKSDGIFSMSSFKRLKKMEV